MPKTLRNAPNISNGSLAPFDYVGAIVTDTDHVAPGGSIDRKYLVGLISDLAGDVAGSISSAADDLAAGRV
jgi:hypothetical protein